MAHRNVDTLSREEAIAALKEVVSVYLQTVEMHRSERQVRRELAKARNGQ